MITLRMDWRKRGFTLAEVLVVIVLGSVVAAALYQTLVYQQRLYTEERSTTYRHDALRLANAVLSADLREASAAQGDFLDTRPDSLSLRSPVGFGIVCAVDSGGGKLGLFNLQGRMGSLAGDSLLIYHPNGWMVRVREATSEEASSLNCPYGGGPTVKLVIRVDGTLTGIPVGAPARAFHRYTYSLQENRDDWWLARTDGARTEILVGPFAGDGTGLSFAYFDAAGQTTTDPARVARVELTLVAESEPYEQLDTLTSTVRPRNQ
ncbi:MAG: prepilin-type N-terminal cleavage/methylation domain-containing protein [Gemmatimonadetes bacterium]|nr:prepilin-type N-terminal cleavage/methylation domain-containing protein [Gemmatimonadota bacterium]NIO31353.1 prepilin-type N-terminal cleavage/methylation domain-containing protein [Gemmatimonadota bacterium]